MGIVSPRVRRRIERDFPAPGSVDEVVRIVGDASDVEDARLAERIQGAIVLWARGSMGRLEEIAALTKMDWRDALCAGGLENEDWPQRMEAELGPPE